MKVLKIWAPAGFVLLLLQQLPEPCEGQTLPANTSLSGCEMEVLTGKVHHQTLDVIVSPACLSD